MSELNKRLRALSPEQRKLLELELQRKGVPVPAPLKASAESGDLMLPEQNVSDRHNEAQNQMGFSLFFFSDDGSTTTADKYRLLLESARYGDRHGFTAVWTPERHFLDFGGLYPNPSILGAALAMITERIRLRAGSVVLPLHNSIRVAEEWSVVDNLSSGRVEVAFASGWHPSDFVLAPKNFADRKQIMFHGIEQVRRLWAGEQMRFQGPQEIDVDLRILPRPVQEHLPVWVTTAGNPQTWKLAGAIGAHILTGMQGETLETLKKKIDLYRESLAEHGHEAESGQVAVMLHTYLGSDLEVVKETVRPAMVAYLQTFLRDSESSTRRSINTEVKNHSDADNELRAALAFEYYFHKNSLLGTPEKCVELVDGFCHIGVTEIACLIDFGLDVEMVLEGLHHLNELRTLYASAAAAQSQEVLK
jgi:natural product biosynthesis luciferase-like monooxygenase protein